jgi:holo-[acyl-carrier protein] synthase
MDNPITQTRNLQSSIYGIGTDLVDASRFTDLLQRYPQRLISRVLSQNEQLEFQKTQHPERFLAKRWAAKEALSKALGLGFRQGLRMNECEVSHDPLGKPSWQFHGQTAEKIRALINGDIHLSISDEPPMAMAFVIITQ